MLWCKVVLHNSQRLGHEACSILVGELISSWHDVGKIEAARVLSEKFAVPDMFIALSVLHAHGPSILA